MVSDPSLSFLSSSIVKEIASYGRDVSNLVPREVSDKMLKKFKK